MECIEWNLVSKRSECDGSETERNLLPNAGIQDCASECIGVSSMFIINQDRSRCFCETAATAEGTCDVINIQGYNLCPLIEMAVLHLYLKG